MWKLTWVVRSNGGLWSKSGAVGVGLPAAAVGAVAKAKPAHAEARPDAYEQDDQHTHQHCDDVAQAHPQDLPVLVRWKKKNNNIPILLPDSLKHSIISIVS